MDDPASPGVAELVVNYRDQRLQLKAGEPFTFGRAESCSLCLDTADRGISRIAGAFVFEHGTWWVVNRSETRALHIVDAVGLSVPLPVSRSGWPSSRRAIDPEGLRVLVTGAVWTHELRCEITNPHAASTVVGHPDWASTATQTPTITDSRKEVLVALVSGYLMPFPRYNPRPLTYSEIADMVGLPRSTVTKRVEAVRTQLKEHGVPGLEDEDARRPLAEWLLSMRLIVPADLGWLTARVASRAATSRPDGES